jgi:hypothetical protein
MESVYGEDVYSLKLSEALLQEDTNIPVHHSTEKGYACYSFSRFPHLEIAIVYSPWPLATLSRLLGRKSP